MCSGGEGKQWSCGKAGVVSLQKVGSLVRDLSEPFLSQSHIQVVITVSSFSFLPLFVSYSIFSITMYVNEYL